MLVDCPLIPGCRVRHPDDDVAWQRMLETAGVRLHPGGHHVGGFPLSEKIANDWFDRDGFFTDERCEANYQMLRREERAWREEMRKLPRSENAWRKFFGLMVEVDPHGPGLDPDEIRARVDIIELALQLSPRLRVFGDRATGPCPLHEDRSPSFSVDRKKGLWNCFGGCGGGDVFSLIMKRYDVGFREALEIASKL